jgi:serine/threonine-protein kinase
MQVGQSIGQYQIREPLGQGAMATVYKAYHPRLNRYVAIKMIHHAHLEDRGFITRFEREAQIVAALEHPNIVQVYDFAEHEGQPYLVMKLIEGCTLKQALSDGPLQLKDILTIIPPLAAALDYAHEQGVLHRDIKPSNVLLDGKSTPYLTDFGLARLAQAGESTLSQDMLLGTPNYISPEQAMGERDIDKRADLYSFGVVLYELLVGQVPYSSGTPLSIVHDHIYRPLPQPSSINAEIPPQVEVVLLKALAKTPDDRYQSSAELVEALRESADTSQLKALNPERRHTIADTLLRIRAEQQVAAQETFRSSAIPTPLLAPAQAPPKARRVPIWLLGLVGVLVLLILVGAVMASRSRPPATRPETSIELYQVPELSLERAANAVTENPNDPVNYLALARAAVLVGNVDTLMRTLLEGARHTDDPVRYWLTVGAGAVQAGHMDVAFAAFREALLRAQSAENYPQVRAFVGEQLYNAVLMPGAVDPVGFRRLFVTRDNETTPPLLDAIYVRALISNGRLPLAGREINRVLREAPDLAEGYLVQGDLNAAAGEQAPAQQDWESAREQIDAPQWVRERATELIESS